MQAELRGAFLRGDLRTYGEERSCAYERTSGSFPSLVQRSGSDGHQIRSTLFLADGPAN
jgi:hypothetical protein